MYDKQRIRTGKLLIRRVFLEEWDPIGIGKESKAQDEYDAYLGGMYSLLARDASEDEVVAHLNWIEGERMGLKPDLARLALVARVLKSLPIRNP